MRKIIAALLSVLFLSFLTECRKLEGIPILSISATSSESGHPASAVLDGNPATYWKPVGDAKNEGLTLTFVSPFGPTVSRSIPFRRQRFIPLH
jgi:hypothetical protein